MAYRMPNKYAKDHDDDDDYSEADESVAESVGIDEGSDFEDDESVEEFSEEEQVDRRAARRGSRGTQPPPPPRSAPRRQLPKRSKSFDGDTRFESMRGGGGGGERSSSRSGDRPSGSSHSRRPPPRSKTFDYSTQSSSRSLGGPKMRRDSAANSKMDKEAIASNRARRLRAMGGASSGAGDKVKLLTRSQSFSNRSSKASSLMDGLDGGEGDGNDDDNDEKSKRTRKPIKRTTSSSYSELPPEEQQYARTAARGVTRSKSLKAQRPNLDKASKNVANRLQAMRVSSGEKDASSADPSCRYRTKDTDGTATDAAKPAPKPVGLQW